MARPRLIVLNVIVLFFNPDVAIALAFENRFCPPYFFLFPFSFFFLFFLFSLSFSPPPPPAPPRAVPVGMGSAGALLPSGGRTGPSRVPTHGRSPGSPSACCSAPPPSSGLDQNHRGFAPPLQRPHEGMCHGGSAQHSGTMTQSASACTSASRWSWRSRSASLPSTRTRGKPQHSRNLGFLPRPLLRALGTMVSLCCGHLLPMPGPPAVTLGQHRPRWPHAEPMTSQGDSLAAISIPGSEIISHPHPGLTQQDDNTVGIPVGFCPVVLGTSSITSELQDSDLQRRLSRTSPMSAGTNREQKWAWCERHPAWLHALRLTVHHLGWISTPLYSESKDTFNKMFT